MGRREIIIIKSNYELDIMRRAGDIVSRIHEAICRYIQPGSTTLALNAIIVSQIQASGANSAYRGYRGYPFASYIDVNDQVLHSLPTNRVLLQGDIATINFGIILEGFCAFQTITYPVGEISLQAKKLLETTAGALNVGIRAARPGARVGDISFAIQDYAEGKNGYRVVREYTGHGIGREMHEEPQIPNFGSPGVGPVLKKGMTLALEPMVNAGDWRTRLGDDHWTVFTADGSLSCSYSHLVAITNSEPEILTPCKMDRIMHSGVNSSLLMVQFDRKIHILPTQSLDEITCVNLGYGPIIISSVQALCKEAHLILPEEIEELEWLLNKEDIREQQLHTFFENHPNFLLGTDYKSLRSKVVLERDTGSSLIPDFFLEPVTGEYWDILDLKLPQKPIAVGPRDRRHFSHHVLEAQAQLRTYGDYFDDPRKCEQIFHRHGIKTYKPRLAVLLGRSFIDEGPIRKDIERDIPNLTVITYDDLLARAKQRSLRLSYQDMDSHSEYRVDSG